MAGGSTRHHKAASAVKVVVTGPFGAGKSTMIRTVSEVTVLSTERATSEGDQSVKSETTVAMDYGRIKVDDDLVLYLFGTPGQDRFDFMWDILGEGMLGYVLVVDALREESLDEAAGILATFRGIAKVPFVVALNRVAEVAPAVERRVRDTLALHADVPVIACDVTDRESVKGVLLELLYAVMEPADREAARA
jgi:signal recognition particle receptor subunit beta